MSWKALSPFVLAATLAGCGREVTLEGAPPDAAFPAPSELSAAEAATGGVPSVGSASGGSHGTTVVDPAPSPLTTVLYSEQDAEVIVRMEGVVRSLAAELGDAVRAGQVLALLENDRQAAQVAAAEAALELARLEHERAVELRSHDLITLAELDAATYSLRTAEATLRVASVELEYTRVLAPFAGTVSRRLVRAGETVAAGRPLFRVTALTPLRAQIRLPETDARGLAPGGAVWLRSLDGRPARGTIARIAPTVDPASGTVELLVDVREAAGLPPGSVVVVDSVARTPRP
jgi:membrane fusion protein (multidrug efflux system)